MSATWTHAFRAIRNLFELEHGKHLYLRLALSVGRTGPRLRWAEETIRDDRINWSPRLGQDTPVSHGSDGFCLYWGDGIAVEAFRRLATEAAVMLPGEFNRTRLLPSVDGVTPVVPIEPGPLLWSELVYVASPTGFEITTPPGVLAVVRKRDLCPLLASVVAIDRYLTDGIHLDEYLKKKDEFRALLEKQTANVPPSTIPDPKPLTQETFFEGLQRWVYNPHPYGVAQQQPPGWPPPVNDRKIATTPETNNAEKTKFFARPTPPRCYPAIAVKVHHPPGHYVIINPDLCQKFGRAIKPPYFSDTPHRLNSAWLVSRLQSNRPVELWQVMSTETVPAVDRSTSTLRLYSARVLQGTYLAVDPSIAEGVYLNGDQFRDLVADVAATTTTLPPVPTTGETMTPRRGRKPENDPETDRAFVDDWQRAKQVGIPFKIFCRDSTVSYRDGRRVLDRYRKRNNGPVKS